MLVNRYKPRKLSEIIGNKIALGKLKDFVSNFNNKKKKAIILYGVTEKLPVFMLWLMK